MADGGICCIDEFNMMRECDKASIHEAMEQQSISMAKAGIVCKLSTRCSIVAATNPKNMRAIEATNGQADVHIGIASPLLSRFDLVLILRDERNAEWDERVAQHLLARCTDVEDDGDKDGDGEHWGDKDATESADEALWTEEQFQAHLAVVRDICPTVSPAANALLGAYFRRCRADVNRDPARTTVRLLDSLMRLSRAHARLMFRNVVTERDAATVVRLMESSWGFGNVLRPQNVLRTPLPIGPSADEVRELKNRLGLSTTETSSDEEEGEIFVQHSENGKHPLDNSIEADMFTEEEDAQDRTKDFTQISLLTNRDFSDSIAKPVVSPTQKRTQQEMEEIIMSFADFVDDPDGESTTDSVQTNHAISVPAKRSHADDDVNDADVALNPPKTLKSNKVLSSKTTKRLNMFCNEKYVDRSSEVEAPKSIESPQSSADQSVLGSMEIAVTSTAIEPSPSSQQPTPSNPFKWQPVKDVEDLDFLDEIDDI